jgi:hypothetical protein
MHAEVCVAYSLMIFWSCMPYRGCKLCLDCVSGHQQFAQQPLAPPLACHQRFRSGSCMGLRSELDDVLVMQVAKTAAQTQPTPAASAILGAARPAVAQTLRACARVSTTMPCAGFCCHSIEQLQLSHTCASVQRAIRAEQLLHLHKQGKVATCCCYEVGTC